MLPLLFTPLAVGTTTARNRVWVAPMCQYSVSAEDGIPTDWHLAHLGALAAGGAGLVMAEATAVRPDGRISPRDTGLWDDAQEDAWRRIVGLIRASGALAGIQLAHAGRKASTYPEWSTDRTGTVPLVEGGWQTIGPSALPFPGLDVPRAMTSDDISAVSAAFADAARRAQRAGFDVVEIHAAHGYLLHQFLSPLSNTRSDKWGGELKNRMRLPIEVIRAVRAEFDGGILVRISATDWLEPEGWTLEQSIVAAEAFHAAGADLIDVSTGGLAPAPIPTAPGYQVRFARAIRHRTGVPTAAVGLLTDAVQAETLLVTGQADAVMLGREHLRDPHVATRFARELGLSRDEVHALCAPQYRRAYR